MPQRWFSWQGGLFTFVLLAAGSAIIATLRRMQAKFWRSRSGAGDGSPRAQIDVGFYERFRKLCAQRGLVREAPQTEREFVHAVNHSLAAAFDDAALKQLAGDLVESFYRVRFGAQALDPLIERDIDRRLTLLEQRLQETRHV